MSTLTQDILAAASENHPPIVDKGSHDTWQRKLLMYVEGKENTMVDLNVDEQKKIKCDIMAANIVLGLPDDIYALLNHRKTDNSIWNMNDDDEENEIQAESAARTHAPLALVAKTCNTSTLYINPTPQYNQQMSYALQQYLNKAVLFLSKSFTMRYPPTNKQLKISSNLKTQANIQYGRVTIQSVPARQTQSCSSNNRKAKASGIDVSKNVVDYAGAYVIDSQGCFVFVCCSI
ncbi:hypothetical protein Tco_1460546 [Tanacetum coccineum]